MKLILNKNLYIKESNISGFGVFTSDYIESDTIIEECHHLPLYLNGLNSKEYKNYRFNFPKDNPKFYSIPLGYGCIYNHSDQNNTTWEIDIERNLFIFRSIKQIKPDEEICTNYGECWWEARSCLNKK